MSKPEVFVVPLLVPKPNTITVWGAGKSDVRFVKDTEVIRLSDHEAAYNKLYEKYADIMLQRNELICLLTAAKCPCCDGSGAVYDNYGGVEQCQWCYEKNTVLKEISDKLENNNG